jgi:hypothetical protein
MDSGVGLVQVVSRKRMPRATALFMGYVFGVKGMLGKTLVGVGSSGGLGQDSYCEYCDDG